MLMPSTGICFNVEVLRLFKYIWGGGVELICVFKVFWLATEHKGCQHYETLDQPSKFVQHT